MTPCAWSTSSPKPTPGSRWSRPRGQRNIGRVTAEYVFEVGIEALHGAGDLVAKLDADVSFDPELLQECDRGVRRGPHARGSQRDPDGPQGRQMARDGFVRQPLLGPDANLPPRVPGAGPPARCRRLLHVGRRDQSAPGRIQTRTLRHLPFFHHRPEGSDEGSPWAGWRLQGEGSYHLGYRPSYLLVRCAYRMTKEVSAIAMLAGYLRAAVRRTPRYPDARMIATIRDQQRVRHFLSAVRRRPASGPTQTASRQPREVLS